MVKADATVMRDGYPEVKRNEALNKKLARQGIIGSNRSNLRFWVFQTDYQFSSATAAGKVIDDGALSTTQDWRNAHPSEILIENLGEIS